MFAPSSKGLTVVVVILAFVHMVVAPPPGAVTHDAVVSEAQAAVNDPFKKLSEDHRSKINILDAMYRSDFEDEKKYVQKENEYLYGLLDDKERAKFGHFLSKDNLKDYQEIKEMYAAVEDSKDEADLALKAHLKKQIRVYEEVMDWQVARMAVKEKETTTVIGTKRAHFDTLSGRNLEKGSQSEGEALRKLAAVPLAEEYDHDAGISQASQILNRFLDIRIDKDKDGRNVFSYDDAKKLIATGYENEHRAYLKRLEQSPDPQADDIFPNSRSPRPSGDGIGNMNMDIVRDVQNGNEAQRIRALERETGDDARRVGSGAEHMHPHFKPSEGFFGELGEDMEHMRG